MQIITGSTLQKMLMEPAPHMPNGIPIAVAPKVNENRYKVIDANDRGYLTCASFEAELNKWAKLGWRLHSYTRTEYGQYQGVLVNDEY